MKVYQFWEYITTGLQIYDKPGSLSYVSKYGPSLSKAVGQVDQSFLVVKKSHFDENIHLTVSTNSTKQKVHIGCQFSTTCLKQPLKKRQKEDVNNKW